MVAIGGGIGTVVFASLYRVLIREYSWRGAMMITGGLTLHYTCCGALFLPVEMSTKITTHDKNDIEVKAQEEERAKSQISLLKDYKMYIMFISHMLWTLGSTIFYMFIVDFAQIQGISRDSAAYMMSISAIGSFLVRVLVSGVFAQVRNFPAIYLYTMFCLLCGVSVMALPLATSYTAMFATCCCIYTFYGGIVVTLGLTTVQMFGMERATTAFGLLMCGCGVGGIAGPPIAGMVSTLI